MNNTGELIGYVPGRNLIINSSDLPLRKVMRPLLHKISPDVTREVIDLAERYKVSSLPVVDMDNYIVGLITYEAVVEAMQDLADETIAQMAGASAKISLTILF